MRIERLLQINMAALAALGTLLLGTGERSLTLPVLAVIVAVSSVYLTDVKGWLVLNPKAEKAAGALAVYATWQRWTTFGSEELLLALANLLTYLQCVLLYRKKTVRSYWLLAVLSLLQVAVAAALNMSVIFGLLLLVYLFVGLLALAVFFLFREQVRFQAAGNGVLPGVLSPAAPRASRSAVVGKLHAAAAPSKARRWPLAERSSDFAARQVAGAKDPGLGRGFLRQVVFLGISTLALAWIMFFALPRPGSSSVWRPRRINPYRTIGFSHTVTLGELGDAYENPEAVMRVQLLDPRTGEVYRVAREPLFRGGLLYTYEDGRWSRRNAQGESHQMPVTKAGDFPPGEQVVLQRISIEARDDDALFYMFPSMLAERNEQLFYNDELEEMSRIDSKRILDYELLTTAVHDHLLMPAVAAPRSFQGDLEGYQLMSQLPPHRADGSDPLAGLKSLAAQLLANLPDSAGRWARAEYLAAHLRSSGEFRYSLRAVERDGNLDPVEDFVVKHKVGHCEYFASALTLMLRSQEIPARMAIGYKGGEWMGRGGYYQVKELHAHTWVEVYVTGETLPPSLATSERAEKNGAWLVLDPTPAADGETSMSVLRNLREMADFSQFLWSTYVLGMDSRRQQEAIFQPLVANIEETLKHFADEEYRNEVLNRISGAFGKRFQLKNGWRSWDGLLLAMAALLALLGAYRGGRWLALKCSRGFARGVGAVRRRLGKKVDFYQRFEALLARHRLRRPASQTQREFALLACGELAESQATQHVAALPRRIVEAYYHVRFGGRELDHPERAAVEQALGELDAALHAAARQRSNRHA